MLKTLLMAGTVLVASPLLAQTQPQTATPPADTVQTAPATADDSAAMPAQTGAPVQQPDAAVQTAAAQPAPAQPATVADAVNTEFASYDKDANGKLSRAEFAAWMIALKTKAEPATRANSPATRQWVAGAFTSADKNHDAVVTRTELTGYLSQGQG